MLENVACTGGYCLQMNIVSHLPADTHTFLPFVHMRIYRTFARSYFTFCPHKSLPPNPLQENLLKCILAFELSRV